MDIFRFKRFEVDQSNCAMKVNTDGVLLGALADAFEPESILDIGTGTGVIALMLTQRFPNAHINAVEIDELAAETAKNNFAASVFSNRMELFAIGFEAFFEKHAEKRYDLIVSNPPFFLNSLASDGAKKNLARHTDEHFFKRLITAIAHGLHDSGVCEMILPLTTASLVKELLPLNKLYLLKVTAVRSFAHSDPHREIIRFGKQPADIVKADLEIYSEPKVYSAVYRDTLKDFLTIF